ncbi:MAG: type II secretion system F family protein [Candidatus Nealsonbacteria bacterium]|nr:type II secretion system F family protein [Candidatus Nealsonbacteria bacterium]
MKFAYQVRTKEGEIQTGVIESSSQDAALSFIQRAGRYVTSIEEIKEKPFYTKRIKIFDRVPSQQLVLFSRQLSIMFKSKIPLSEALHSIADQTKNIGFKEKILELFEDVEAGTSFSKALSSHPGLFSVFYVNMVKSGEASGNLSHSLNYLAEHLEKEHHLRSKIKGAMIYPIFVIMVMVTAFLAIILFVLPELTKLLEAGGGEIPAITMMVIGLSDFLKKWGWLLVLGLIGLIIFAYRSHKTQKGKEIFDRIVLGFPIIGELTKKIHLIRFGENLSTLISGGIPISKALEISGDVIDNTIYKKAILDIQEAVKKGEPLNVVLRKSPGLFSPLFSQMVSVGEKTGTVDRCLMNMVEFYQKEVERNIDTLLSLIEPILIIFLGVMVGGLVASVLIPIYQMAAI